MNLDLFTYTPGERRERTSRTTGKCPEAPLTGDEGGNAPAGTAATYPDAPGYKERNGTSQAAAEAMAPRAGTLRAMALDALRRAPEGLTADEIATACGVDRLAIRPRVTELGKMGLAVKTAGTRANASGKAASVWVSA